MPRRFPAIPAGLRTARRWFSPAWTSATSGKANAEDEPLRAALFSADQLAAHGSWLARAHVLSQASLPDRMLARLAANERVLLDFGTQFAITAGTERRVTPAAEWLLDNFYLIEE